MTSLADWLLLLVIGFAVLCGEGIIDRIVG